MCPPDSIAERNGQTRSVPIPLVHGAGDSSAVSPRRPRILLVDDDTLMLGIQARMLQDMGFSELKTASSAEAALTTLELAPTVVDIIVCDLNMPGMDGIEFLQTLNAKDYCGHVILLSGEGSRIMQTVQKLLGGGRMAVLGALVKPAGRVALRALLDTWKPVVATKPASPLAIFASSDLSIAVREQQWVLHYQPKVDLKTGMLVGVEALVRWTHPEHGLVYPDRFIGLAEDCGAIDNLTDWVTAEAMRQLVRWQRAGLRTKVAINVSMENLLAPDFAKRMEALARATGAAPQDVILEVTESRLMSPSSTPLENLVRLRMQRFELSIDDFGTGHSSLAQLRDVPFTELKIDRGFVQGARYNQIIRPILEGAIGIAKRLQMRSVAEGVETEEDWHLLREIGCDFAQGWFVGRPMPSDKVPEWLQSWLGRCGDLVTS